MLTERVLLMLCADGAKSDNIFLSSIQQLATQTCGKANIRLQSSTGINIIF
jgi:hypothetical protein